ncbi:MAG: hypothetical protein ACFCUE_06385 [Candidatus Bathyarchaeia archaeon]|jgi:hypothetical protein
MVNTKQCYKDNKSSKLICGCHTGREQEGELKIDFNLAFTPLIVLAAGIILGTLFKFTPIKITKIKNITVIVFAVTSAFATFILSTFFSNELASIIYFQNFANILNSTAIASFFGGSTQLAATVLLICLFEVSLISSFAIQETTDGYLKKRKNPAQALSTQNVEAQLEPCQNLEPPQTTVEEQTVNGAVAQEKIAAEIQGLKKDEQSIMELFLYEKITQITPNLNAMQPEGYSYEGLPYLDWDIKRTRQTLEALVNKGFLKSELVDKVITCTACGSANVRIKKLCPECSSLRLRKEVLIEHLNCGAIDRQTAFETQNGDLTCPKCSLKLQKIGEDYRLLPSSYVCLNCNARSSEPLLVAKCDNCLTTAQLDEEPEIYLYKYTANSEMPLKDMQQIKPIEVCTKFFRALGYKVISPAYVNGKSGTKHLFDMLVLGKVGVVGAGNQTPQKPGAACTCKGHENTVIELLIANNRVDLEEITRIYGMINDVDCDALIFVIPSMTVNARNYALAYNMKVCEGKTIEEALVNWVIPKTEEKMV